MRFGLNFPFGRSTFGSDVNPFVEAANALVRERILSQHPDSDPDEFALFIESLTEQSGEFQAAVRRVALGFDISTALGAQLNIIGSLLDLKRSGVDDERYRTFLTIQQELLRSAQAEAPRTGSIQNIVRICRLFIGELGPGVVLRNLPPLSYAIYIRVVTFSEQEHLMKFLRKASDAGVLGHVSTAQVENSVWGVHRYGSRHGLVSGAARYGHLATTE